MEDATQKMLVTLAGSFLRKGLTVGGTALAAHGVIAGNQTEMLVTGGMAVAGVLWSFWNDYGRAIALAKLEVWKAAAVAQAAALQQARVPAPTATQIAERIPDPKVTAEVVAKTIAAGCIALLAVLLVAAPAFAQPDRPAGKKLTGNIVNDIRQRTDSADAAAPLGSGGSKGLQDLIGALDAKLLPDLKYAKKLADSASPPNTITGDCYGTWIKIIESRQNAVKDEQGNDLPMPDPALITRFEQLVELRNQLQPNSEFMVKCSPVAQMVKRDVVGFIGVVITGGAGLATLVPGL